MADSEIGHVIFFFSPEQLANVSDGSLPLIKAHLVNEQKGVGHGGALESVYMNLSMWFTVWIHPALEFCSQIHYQYRKI